jgi:hypothetical protein
MERSVKKKIQKRYDEEFERQAVELVIHTGERNLTLNVLCLICFGFKRDIASLTKGIPQAVAASHNL